MKRNSRTWKILESVNPRTSSQDVEEALELLEQVSNNSFEVISSEAFNFTIPGPPSPTAVQQIDVNLEQNSFLDTCFIRPDSPLTTLNNVLNELNEDLFLSDSSNECYVPAPDECIISSTDCSSSTATEANNRSTNSIMSTSILNSEINNLEESVNVNTTNASGVVAIIPGYQNRKRKRRGQADPSEWKKNMRKEKRQKGEPYLSTKGILIPGKSVIASKCMGMCREKCTEKFSEEERLNIFSSFWNIENADQKRQFIVSLISRIPTKTRRTANLESKRKMTNNYFLKKNGDSEKIKVCQKFFLATLNVSETYVRFCLKKCDTTGVVETDQRGKHPPHNKKSEETLQFIREHINSFPRTPAHYVRKDTKKEYLDKDLNVAKMYELYKMKCDEMQREHVDIAYYRKIFNKEFNIGFHKPRKDLCDKCFVFENLSAEDKEKQQTDYEDHMKRKVAARQHRDEAKSLAESGEIHFVEYDLEAICSCPSSSSKLIYYKRRISVFNFTMLDFEKEKRNVYCYCWHEGIGKKGAIEIGTCLLKYLKNKADSKPVTFMSDTCASQCRNMYISSLLLYCVEAFDIPVINQKYFEPGHSQMEADNIHATIELAKKNIPIFHPSGFYTIIRTACRKNPYDVVEMETEDFIDIKKLKTILIKNAKVDCNGEPVNWLKIRWLQYRKADPKHIYFKYNLDDTEFLKIIVIRRGKRIATDKIVLKNAYDGPLPISVEKYEDLKDLCRQGIIPTQYHSFYEHFKGGTANDEEDD